MRGWNFITGTAVEGLNSVNRVLSALFFILIYLIMNNSSDFFKQSSLYLSPQIYVDTMNYYGVLCTSGLDYEDSFEDIIEENGNGSWY